MIEGLLSAFAESVSVLEPLTEVFLRANGYSLARALGASADSISANGPGSFGGPFVVGGQALAVLAAFGLASSGPRADAARAARCLGGHRVLRVGAGRAGRGRTGCLPWRRSTSSRPPATLHITPWPL